jgi:TrmH family RNA methyltransferase
MEPLSKAKIKIIHSLQHKKFRLKYNKFIVEGLKINLELMMDKRHIIQEVYISNPDYLPETGKAVDQDKITLVTPQQMQQISQMTTPPGILSVCALPKEEKWPDVLTGLKMFYLDSVRDPGNLGNILRIADWFGLDYVVCSPDCVDIFNQKVIQASMGSALRVKTSTVDKSELLEKYQSKLFVCDSTGLSIQKTSPPPDGIMIFGNESSGISGELMENVNVKYAIPGDRSLGAESLNVASAAAVIAAWWTWGSEQ